MLQSLCAYQLLSIQVFFFFFLVMYCSDPGHVEHSTRSLSDPKLLVGTTIQYSCNPGFILQGGATITCYGREPGTPVWTSRLPHCVCEYQDSQCKTVHELQVCFYNDEEESFNRTQGLHGSLVIHHAFGLVQPCEQDRQFHIVNCRWEALSLWICDLTWVGLCDFFFSLFFFCTKKKKMGQHFSLCWHRSQRLSVSSTAFSSYDWRCVSVHVCFSGLLMFMQSVWYVNAMLMHRTNQPSATWRRGWRLSMSHVTSARACQICRSGCDAKPLTCVEKTRRDPA